MRKNIDQAFQSLISGKSFRTKNGSLCVREGVAYSYAMPIAWMNNNTVTVTSEKSPTKTTTKHINGFKFLSLR